MSTSEQAIEDLGDQGTSPHTADIVTTPGPPSTTARSVEHRDWGTGRVMRVEGDRIAVFFDSEGYRTLALAAVTDHDLLTRTDRTALDA